MTNMKSLKILTNVLSRSSAASRPPLVITAALGTALSIRDSRNPRYGAIVDCAASPLVNSNGGSRLNGRPLHKHAAQCTGAITSFRLHGLWERRSMSETIKVKLADIGEGIAQVELLKWHKAVGDTVSEMDPICEVQSDKSAVEISSRYVGTVKALLFKVGDMIKIGEQIMEIESDSVASHQEVSPPPLDAPVKEKIVAATLRLPQPLTVGLKAMATRLGVDLEQLSNSLGNREITRQDVLKHSKEIQGPSTCDIKPSSQCSFSPTAQTIVPLKPIQRAMWKSMEASLAAPTFSIAHQVVVTSLHHFRQQLNQSAAKQKLPNITLTPLLIKAISLALLCHPIINSRVVPESSSYKVMPTHDIATAIDSPHGLLVPVLRDVAKLSLVEIQAKLIQLKHKADNNKFSPQDFVGGTMGLSNLGPIGGHKVTPRVFDNQVCILGFGKSQLLPRYNEAFHLEPQQVLEVTLTADHRVVDGATAGRFLADLTRLLESPALWLMNMK